MAVLGVIAAYGVVSPAAAFAASLTGSSFEIDGAELAVTDANLVVDDGGIDWLNDAGTAMRDGVQVRDDLPTGQTDDSFTQGTNINNPPGATVTLGGIPNNKSDLTHFGIYKEPGDGDPFINVFWSRVQAPSGTTTMDFEFNQSSARSNDWGSKHPPYYPDEVIPVRTAGDILISYLLENGGTHPTLTKRSWILDTDCPDNDQCWGPVTTFSASDALGAINTSAITAANSDGIGPLDPFTFGEASIRLSAFAGGQDTCTTFGSVYLRSRSSATDTDENKDFIAPEPIEISNCGRINIHKTQGGTTAALEGAEFTLYKDVSPTGNGDGQTSAGAEDKTAANTVDTCTTDSSGDCSFTDVKKGQYWVVETDTPDGYDTAPDQHVTITAGDQVENLHFDDPIQYGHIIVIKDAQPNDAQDFTFSLDGDPDVTLDDDPGSVTSNSHDYTVRVGAHSLAETNIPSGWTNTSINCLTPGSGSSATPNLTTSTTAITVGKNETVTCTYVDVYTPTAPGLTTTANVTSANTSWTDTATLTGDGTHPVTGSVSFYLCGPTAAAADCTSTANQVGSAVTVANGSATSDVTSPTAAGNYCFRAVYTSDSPFYTGAAHTNATTECFLKRNANLTVSKTATPSFGRAYAWDVTKVVDGPDSVQVPAGTTHAFPYKVTVSHTATDSTWRVTGVITVANSNGVAFTGVDVTDTINNAGTCLVTEGSNVTVPANGSVELSYSCTYASAPAPGTNTARATWNDAAFFTAASYAEGTAPVTFVGLQPTTTDRFVTVTDTLGGTLGTIDGAASADPTVYTYSVEQTAPEGTCATYPNTATITTVRDIAENLIITPTVVTLDSASASASLCGGLPLGVGATAGGSLDRTFQWLIDKSVDDTDVTLDNGQSATFAYTVTVTPNGAVDSGYALSGTVTVSNPNDWEDITADVTVGTDLGGGADCTVVDGDDVVIPKGEGASFAYSCTFTGTPALTGTVTATATWDAAAAATSASSASAPVPVSLVVATETNRTITVTDDKTDPANPVELGTWTFDDGAHAFTYSLTKDGVAGTAAAPGCVDYTNVAMIVETQQSDTQVVTLCHTFTGGGGTPVVNPPQGGGLPFTGDALALLARTALALLGGGMILLLLSRKQSLTRLGRRQA